MNVIQEIDKHKFISALLYLKVMEDLTCVPIVVIGALWYMTNRLKFATKDRGGPFKIDISKYSSKEIKKQLVKLHRLSNRDINMYERKPISSFMLNGILACIELKNLSQYPFYPDMHLESALEPLSVYCRLKEVQAGKIIDVLQDLEEVLKEVSK